MKIEINKTMCCSICKGDNITWRMWVDELENTKDGCEDNFVYCDDCEDETTATFKIAGEEQ